MPDCRNGNASWGQFRQQNYTPAGNFGSQNGQAVTPQKIAGVDDSALVSSMKSQLQSLDGEDPAAVLVARGITKLGLESSERLRQFFSHYGTVKDVHVPFVLKKRRGVAKLRPDDAPRQQRVAGRGFVVFSSAVDAARILAMGLEPVIHGVAVTLEPFSLASKEGGD
jgi:hypothetical protein